MEIPNQNSAEIMETFNQTGFEEELKSGTTLRTDLSYSHFHNVFLQTWNKSGPIKKKVFRFNHNPIMAKTQRRAIMIRAKLKTSVLRGDLKIIGVSIKTKEALCEFTTQSKNQQLHQTKY